MSTSIFIVVSNGSNSNEAVHGGHAVYGWAAKHEDAQRLADTMSSLSEKCECGFQRCFVVEEVVHAEQAVTDRIEKKRKGDLCHPPH